MARIHTETMPGENGAGGHGPKGALMAARLGNDIYWLCATVALLAGLLAAGTFFFWSREPSLSDWAYRRYPT